MPALQLYIQLEHRISIIISCGFDIITSSCEFMLVPSYCWPVIYYKVFSEWDKLLIASNITLAASLIEEYFCPSIVIWVSEFRCPMAWINCILYSFEIIIYTILVLYCFSLYRSTVWLSFEVCTVPIGSLWLEGLLFTVCWGHTKLSTLWEMKSLLVHYYLLIIEAGFPCIHACMHALKKINSHFNPIACMHAWKNKQSFQTNKLPQV